MTKTDLKGHLLTVLALAVALLAPARALSQPQQFERQPRPETGVRVNTVGYLPGEVKRATVVGATGEVTPFEIVDAGSGAVAYTGTLGESRHHADSQEEVRTADFTDLQEAGEYAINWDASLVYALAALYDPTGDQRSSAGSE